MHESPHLLATTCMRPRDAYWWVGSKWSALAPLQTSEHQLIARYSNKHIVSTGTPTLLHANVRRFSGKEGERKKSLHSVRSSSVGSRQKSISSSLPPHTLWNPSRHRNRLSRHPWSAACPWPPTISISSTKLQNQGRESGSKSRT